MKRESVSHLFDEGYRLAEVYDADEADAVIDQLATELDFWLTRINWVSTNDAERWEKASALINKYKVKENV